MERERMIEIPKITDHRGSLSFAEIERHIPFPVSLVSLNTEKIDLEQREEIIIALSGQLNILVNGNHFLLNQPDKILYIPPSAHRTIENLSADAIYLLISPDGNNRNSVKRSTPIQKYTIRDCTPAKLSGGGNHSVIDNIPFDIKRIFYIYGIPSGEKRGMHAHKICHEILIAVSGSFDVELDDGTDKKTVTLDNPAYGLHVPPGIWAVEKGYSQDAVCLVFASDKYDAKNYINSYPEFIKYRQDGN
ncbi:WxcM-like domain-containing protein [Dysgonomonas sp. 521]|uniref:WxcM-like domain-containing protein n=1 Tax=Dysgonomonas sp. 521 TaxID=2302932 RepID=UPI0013D1996A|nr:WxcM-like domain-containing protein [Dysgonomonas sp. 521]NDV94665.1 WxcM-like domain-containing protein [Dysgonomonas sp. 521]